MKRFALYIPDRDLGISVPIHPVVNLVVGDLKFKSQEGHILLSSDLASDTEIDETVNRLIEELEEFRVCAKKELQRIISSQIKKPQELNINQIA